MRVPKLTIASPLAPPFLIPGEVITCTGMVIDALNNELHHGTLRISPLSASRIDGGNYTYTRTSASTAVLNYETSVGQMGDFSEEENGSIQLTFTSPTGGTFTSSACYVGMDRDGLFGGCLLKSGTFSITRK